MNTPVAFDPMVPCWKTIGVFSQAVVRCERLSQVGHCYRCSVFAKAARQILDRDTEVDVATMPAVVLPRKADQGRVMLFIFRLGKEWFGWPLAKVREISEFRPIHAIPNQQNPWLRGLVNINGEPLLCISLGLLLGVQRQGTDAERILNPRMLVIGTPQAAWVVPLSEARGRAAFAADAIMAAPLTAGTPSARYSLGQLTWEGKQVNYLDSEAVLHALQERSQGGHAGL